MSNSFSFVCLLTRKGNEFLQVVSDVASLHGKNSVTNCSNFMVFDSMKWRFIDPVTATWKTMHSVCRLFILISDTHTRTHSYAQTHKYTRFKRATPNPYHSQTKCDIQFIHSFSMHSMNSCLLMRRHRALRSFFIRNISSTSSTSPQKTVSFHFERIDKTYFLLRLNARIEIPIWVCVWY